MSGTAGIATGTTPSVSADPLGDTLPYMSVEGGSTEQVVFGTARTSISIYWGSIDGNQGGNNNLNTFAITVDGFTLTGADLVARTVAIGHGTATSSHLLVTSWLRSPALPLSRLRRSPPPTMRLSSALFGFCTAVSGAVDLGDDDAWLCRSRLRRVPPEHEGSSARHLIRFVSKYMRRAAARRPFFCGQASASLRKSEKARRA